MFKILLSAALLFSTSFSYAQSSRLISEMHWRYQAGAMTKIDTTNYTYSWGRGESFGTGSLLFGNNKKFPWDEGVTWRFDANGALENSGKTVQQFDSDNRLIVAETYSWINSNWVLTSTKTYYYNANSQIDSIHYISYNNGVVSGKTRTVSTYGQYGLVTELTQDWDVAQSIYLDRRYVTNIYNSSGLKIKMTTELFSPNPGTGIQDYIYIGNDLDSMYYNNGAGESGVYKYIYDSNNDNVETTVYYITGSNAGSSSTTYYTYDNNHNMLSSQPQYYTAGQPTYAGLRKWTYNSFNQLTSLIDWWNWDGTQFQHGGNDREYYYHYEEYNPLSTGSVVKENVSLQVFPNPATNTINIQAFTEQKEVFGVTIYDATGKSVRHWNEAPTSMYQKQVDVSGLASGNYFLRIDNQPQESIKFTILK